ncbi:MAG: STAS domain-containing protein [Gammaproteobacteria bacterium]|nr:STAS domain-containing protein [Thiopseudomonas sp.]MCK9464583.1 STAS domain-containing protein [Thiopseudomonas sp.]NLC09135.1 STAS domain-containing protein [Gammaproteobacteria bacterium]
MSSGKIKFAEQDQTFVLKCIGEVRLNFCAVLNETIEQAIATGNSKAIIIDLTEVTSIDSTTLGLLAKLSILSRKSFGMLPTLASTNPDISQQLDAMGFAQVFNIVHTPAPCPECLNDLPDQPQSEEVVRERVLEAHRILMELNESNRTAFRDLVSLLEETGQSC